MAEDKILKGLGTAIKITALHLPKEAQGGNFVFFPYCVKPAFVINVSNNWSSTPAYGKMDEIPFYSHTTKVLNVSFTAKMPKKITRKYLPIDLNQSVAKLQQFQYPLFKGFPMASGGSHRVIKAPPFFKVEHFDSFKGQYSYFAPISGYMSGQGMVINPGHAKNDLIAGQTNGTNGGALLEKSFEISFDLTVLHHYLPGYDEGGAYLGDNMYNFQNKRSVGTVSYYGGAGMSGANQDMTLDEAKVS